ncbi:MAG: dTDP-4-dehydrorhamnose reductase [Gammaproteobacteria bacterium]|nr:dTDP-4-dehydrorhamnose reductase [Gammaproteobacteria bacterium]
MTKERLLLTGSKGQLGRTFTAFFAGSGLTNVYEIQEVDIEELDFTDRNSILSALSFYNPSTIVNCGAYTAVDHAEENEKLARKINDDAVAIMADWSRKEKSRLIHISTDFVFDGRKRKPYLPDDVTNPLGVYGKTKLAGEGYVLNRSGGVGVVIRSSWLYSEFCSNFVKTMLALMGNKKEIKVVNDQVGSPTSTHSLVRLLFSVIDNKLASGIFHWCDGAAITWYDFAVEIQKQAFDIGVLRSKIPIRAINTSAYPTLAKRPPYSVLDRKQTLNQFGIEVVGWREELRRVIGELARAG